MSVVLVTGSGGLIGSESVRFFSEKGFKVVGIDNDMRKYFFGEDASTSPIQEILKKQYGRYELHPIDIRNYAALQSVFKKYGRQISLIIHTAAQPSHDWAAREPLTDFTINANGTLNLLEQTRLNCPEAVFIFTSTNKVYGDKPNYLPFEEKESRWEIAESSGYSEHGIDESMPIDQCLHSVFGASKVAADITVQEYGRYFDMATVSFRGGCLTGPSHQGAELHGFLAYLVKCTVRRIPYTIYGYDGKQVRDIIHSSDLLNAFWHYYQNPRKGEVYNIGGSRHSNTSVLEAIEKTEKLSSIHLDYSFSNQVRPGDHRWYISDIRKFRKHYPQFEYKYSLDDIILEMIES